MERTFKDVGKHVTIETCLMYWDLGISCGWNDGKHVTLDDREVFEYIKKDLPAGEQK